MNWASDLRCVAITVRGLSCRRPAKCAIPVVFEYDPTSGAGTFGPHVTLCRMHDWPGDARGAEGRLEIIGGWLGWAWNPKAQVWTVLTTVYETRDGLTMSKRWWDLRTYDPKQDLRTYDEASMAETA